jgi:predicted transcriptional regulator
MLVSDLKAKRLSAGIPGQVLALKAGIDRARLSRIERGYVNPSTAEVERLDHALTGLIDVKGKVLQAAEQLGWPVAAL